MSRRSNDCRFNSSDSLNILLSKYNMPAGVVIGKKGSTIKYMSNTSGANMRVKDDTIIIRGGHKQRMEAKRLLKQLETNFQNGIPGFIISAPQNKSRKQRPVIRTDTDGWSTKGQYKTEEKTSEPQKVNTDYSGSFAGLDTFDSDDGSDEDRPYPEDDGGDYVSMEAPCHPTWRNRSDYVSMEHYEHGVHRKRSNKELNINDKEEVARAISESMQGRYGVEAVGAFAKRLPNTRTYEEIHKEITGVEQLIASLDNSWADAADREDYEAELKELQKELATVDRIQLLIQEHPDM